MAAPHVSGTIALMLQHSPNLQAVDIPSIIRETARQDPNTGLLASGSPIWGFGKIDARTATGLIRLTLIVNGLPPGSELPVNADEKVIQATSDSWLDLYFPQGTTNTVVTAGFLNTSEGTQYQLANARIVTQAKTTNISNYVVKASIEFDNINETEILVLNYEHNSVTIPLTTTQSLHFTGESTSTIFPVPNPLIIVLVALLVLAIVAFSITFDHVVRKKINRAEFRLKTRSAPHLFPL